jgi:hypothetical protein
VLRRRQQHSFCGQKGTQFSFMVHVHRAAACMYLALFVADISSMHHDRSMWHPNSNCAPDMQKAFSEVLLFASGTMQSFHHIPGSPACLKRDL